MPIRNSAVFSPTNGVVKVVNLVCPLVVVDMLLESGPELSSNIVHCIWKNLDANLLCYTQNLNLRAHVSVLNKNGVLGPCSFSKLVPWYFFTYFFIEITLLLFISHFIVINIVAKQKEKGKKKKKKLQIPPIRNSAYF